ncbi:phosphatase 2C [Thraustotheca clavata]|uniref:Phosphatase 2C n=1 Tax=Thraustotheca clavata TaxID=74557 RepID=A0A1V9YZH5_9STRA|nr:phosphatase 2C [Thraustotheca clavata]
MVRHQSMSSSSWANLLVLSTAGVNISKLTASVDGLRAFSSQLCQSFHQIKFTHVAMDRHASPQLHLLAGALAMHTNSGVVFVQDMTQPDQNLLFLTDLVENGADFERQMTSALQKCTGGGKIIAAACICAKEELVDSIELPLPWFVGWSPKGVKVVATKPRGFDLRHCTTTYEGNIMSEDRSDHWSLNEQTALYSVYDGHGGEIAVNFIHANLSKLILNAIEQRGSPLKRKRDALVLTSSSSIPTALQKAYLECDELLRNKLKGYGPTISASKGFCNTGSCAVTALFHGNEVYIANVGDCQAILGYSTSPLQIIEPAFMSAKILSTNHDCNNPDEVKKVVERSKDRNAIRMSKDDRVSFGEYGIKRVAGTLSVTRALGDWYLKAEEFSSAPYKSKVPYITAEPDVIVHTVTKHDKFIILASDGLWEVISPELAVQIVANYATNAPNAGDAPIPSASQALVHTALDRAASKEGMALHDLLAIAKGPQRRSIHDDITCTVIFLEHQ